MHYFARPIPGTLYTRYSLGHVRHGAFHVTGTQISRPEGEQVAEPAVVIVPRARPDDAPPRRAAPRPAPEHKRCSLCREIKPASAFATHADKGLQAYCSACSTASGAERRRRRIHREAAHA